VEAKVGKAHGHEGAAGSQYILVPVQLAAKQADGSVRRYEGDMALRKVVADGASAAERRWHLHEGRITRLPDTH
jgi:hypothetical protein